MSIFQYQGQEEDHYTNLLLSILKYQNNTLVKPFLQELIPIESNDFEYSNVKIENRKKFCPQENKNYEYIMNSTI